MMYTVSVIIPIYKVEKYIERCAVSLFNQSLSNIEYIFINDKTPDGSVEKLKEVCSRYPSLIHNIRIIEHKQNSGLAATRITGIKAAKGKYIAFCDSDDWVEPRMYELLYNKAEDLAADITYCNYYIDFSNKTLKSKLCEAKNISDYRLKLLCGLLPSFCWMRLYRKNVLTEHIYKLYTPGINMWEDVMMNITLSLYVNKVAFISNAGYHYNQYNENSYTTIWSYTSKENISYVTSSVSCCIENHKELQLYLKYFRLNALYSIISHSTLPQLKLLKWKWVDDISVVFNHPNMPIANKLICKLYSFHSHTLILYIVKIKRTLRKLLLKK